jgi:hypothetical protein
LSARPSSARDQPPTLDQALLDGMPRVEQIAFIVADQAPAVIAPVLHAVAIILGVRR